MTPPPTPPHPHTPHTLTQVPQNRLQPTRRALRDFNEIVFDKKALLVLIRTLEEQRGFTIRDKSVVGSLLVVVLHKRMDYATA